MNLVQGELVVLVDEDPGSEPIGRGGMSTYMDSPLAFADASVR